MANVAVILSGCGVFDGAEIHESVLTLLALEENQADYQCFAPDISNTTLSTTSAAKKWANRAMY